MNLYQMTRPNDREYPPEQEWDDLCLAAKMDELDQLTKEQLIDRLLVAEVEVEQYRYEAKYWRLRYLGDAA